MYLKIFLNIFLMALLLMVQVAFISGLPSWFANINFVLVIVILIMGFGNSKTAFIWAMAAGLLLDIYSFSSFGLHTISIVASLFLTSFLLDNLLTNRSLYTFLVLTFLASIIYEFLSFLILTISGLLTSRSMGINFSGVFWIDEASKIIVNMMLTFLLFHLLSFFSKRFRPMFLIK